VEREPYYAAYTLAELLSARNEIDREKYPERALRLDEEIARRPGPAEPIPEWNGGPSDLLQELPVEFRGAAREYFRIWIVNLCLTVLTLGIFSAWAKVRKKRYAYSHTIVGGTPFQYLGQPIPILKGRIIAALGFGLYYVSSHFITSLLPYVLAGGLVVAPWVLVCSAAFNARYSAFRNMTFHFEGSYLDVLKAFCPWCIFALLVVVGMLLGGVGSPVVSGIASLLFAFSFPWFMRRLKKFIVEHTSYGGRTGAFFATGGQFFKIYFLSGLIGFVVAIPTVVLMLLLSKSAHNFKWLYLYLGLAPIYAGYVLGYAYLQSRSGNLVWNNTRLGPVCFRSTLRCVGLLKLYVTNALGIVASLGLLIPWAVMRTLKYRADNMRVLQEGELTEFEGSDTSAVAAVGAEAVDFFDVDLSL
jgi:uncharacterized membrane protein YjgN (DUF898 family)